jgi:hypothetical protein
MAAPDSEAADMPSHRPLPPGSSLPDAPGGRAQPPGRLRPLGWSSLALAVALAIGGGVARAEEEDAAPADPPELLSPEERTRRAEAAFPSPSAAEAFDVRGDLVGSGGKVGTMSLAVRPAAGFTPGWDVVESLEAAGLVQRATYRLDRRLDLERGEFRRELAGAITEVTVTRSGGAYDVTIVRGEERTTDRIEGAVGLKVSPSGIALFARMLPEEAAVYPVRVFEPFAEPAAGSRAGEGRSVVAGIETTETIDTVVGGEDVRAWIVILRKGGSTVRYAFEPEKRNLLSIRNEAQASEFVVGGAAGEADAGAAPTTPQAAALEAAVAYATADADALDPLVDWDAAHAAYVRYRKDMPDLPERDRAAYREHVLEQVRKRTAMPAAEARAALGALLATIEPMHHSEGGRILVFPEPFHLTFVVAQSGGVWRVTEVP